VIHVFTFGKRAKKKETKSKKRGVFSATALFFLESLGRERIFKFRKLKENKKIPKYPDFWRFAYKN
jgi:hypothetical protein